MCAMKSARQRNFTRTVAVAMSCALESARVIYIFLRVSTDVCNKGSWRKMKASSTLILSQIGRMYDIGLGFGNPNLECGIHSKIMVA